MGGRVEIHVISKLTTLLAEGDAGFTGLNNTSGNGLSLVPTRYILLYMSVIL